MPVAIAVLSILAGVAALAGRAAAAPLDVVPQTSSNWAGYVVTGLPTPATDPATGQPVTDPVTGAPVTTPTTTTYSTASGTWTQPRAVCTLGSRAYSAFWVGLGGFSDGSQALEQIGTESDCTTSGRASYSVWYELVPDGPVSINLKLLPGDTVSASVAVSGQSVTVNIQNITRKKTFSKVLTMAVAPDVSSAEWIAEAPSTCRSASDCSPLPLTNFGTVPFRSASATTTDGVTGTISNPLWSTTSIALQGTTGLSRFRSRYRFGPPAVVVDATPSPLSSDGSSFTVTWSRSTPSGPPAAPLP